MHCPANGWRQLGKLCGNRFALPFKCSCHHFGCELAVLRHVSQLAGCHLQAVCHGLRQARALLHNRIELIPPEYARLQALNQLRNGRIAGCGRCARQLHRLVNGFGQTQSLLGGRLN